MNARCLIITAVCMALSLPAYSAAKKGDVLEGTAFAIDGDTIELQGVRVRLSGLDAPEIDSCEGRFARVAMDTLLERLPVTCVFEGRKSYKREVGTCSNSDGNLTEQMIVAGHGIEYRTYSNRYRQQEVNAAAEKRGPLWNREFCH